MISVILLYQAKKDIQEYIEQLNEYLDKKLTVRIPSNNPEYWTLLSENTLLTEGDPYDIVQRVQQIAREHGAQWELPNLAPDSWWPTEEI